MKVPAKQIGRAGFTLMELLVVMVMMAIVATIALPRINVSRIRSKAAIQALGTTMLALQREAIARQHNIVVIVDAAARSLRVVYDSTNDLTWNNNERMRAIPLGEEIVFGKPAAVPARTFGANPVNFTTVEVGSGLPAIVLYRNGSAREFGGLYLSTRKAMAGAPGHQGETWAMEMIRATGRAEWLRWNGTTWIRGF
ncbi:MAG TPA: prepilin-type N-terminal cleavage/methylation domain-containing protein [Gemmatimonadales bacterium]|jgi:prepilin-type N-terminal cleavage/methylation domain-containing protein|nr:prepilin-type N-terminal cleavage/methylation domain-containing protein [Gemmatimonadales bacterium]